MDLYELLTRPAAEISAIRVRSFLALKLAESRLHDYKATVDAAMRTLAAFANTAGGVVLIGIEDKTLQVLGVAKDSATSLHNKCWAQLDPPFSPEVIPVEMDGRMVLVVRVEHHEVRRPVFLGGAVHYRIGDTTKPADRAYVQALFAETASGGSGGHMIQMGGLNLESHDDRRLTIRMIANAELPRRPVGPIWIGTPLRSAVQAVLRTCVLTDWLIGNGDGGSWVVTGHNTSQGARWEWTCNGATFAANVVAELTGHPTPLAATCWIDMTVFVGPDQRLAPNDLFHLLHSVVATMTRTVGPAVFEDLIRGPWIAYGPVLILDTAQTALIELVSLGEQGIVAGTRPRPMRAQMASSIRWPTTDENIHAQIKEWLTRMALDAGLLGAETSIDGLPL